VPRLAPPDVDRVAAAQAAVAARRARALIKRDVASRARTALAVAEHGWAQPDSAEGGMRVRDLLLAVPTLGPTRVAKVMESLKIADSKRIAGLGVRQRAKLVEYLARRENAVPAEHRLVVLAGPTAVGKGTVSTYIREHYPNVLLSVSATTRPPRPGEVDGVHYYFVSDDEFDGMIERHEFLEWATVHNSNRYGTPRPPIERALARGRSVLLEIDIQGARQVREAMPEAMLVFLLPPTWDELVRRLTGRGTESAEEQERRLATAKVELAAQDEFDFRVVNNDVALAAAEVVELTLAPAPASAPTGDQL
jgi:guanylate kinase